jgi:hypothetical protein
VLALVVGGAVFGIASVVQADIPDSGVIHGCYGKPGTTYKGQLRVRDASQGEQCRFYENPVDWSVSGVSGATGATGATGPTGPAGVPGLALTGNPLTLPGPVPIVIATLGCADLSKIAIGGDLFDLTNAGNTTLKGSGNNGVLNGGAANAFWNVSFSLGATFGPGDTIQFQIECANPPVSNAAQINPSTSKPTVKIVTRPLR